jgi:hypothetical protein
MLRANIDTSHDSAAHAAGELGSSRREVRSRATRLIPSSSCEKTGLLLDEPRPAGSHDGAAGTPHDTTRPVTPPESTRDPPGRLPLTSGHA